MLRVNTGARLDERVHWDALHGTQVQDRLPRAVRLLQISAVGLKPVDQRYELYMYMK